MVHFRLEMKRRSLSLNGEKERKREGAKERGDRETSGVRLHEYERPFLLRRTSRRYRRTFAAGSTEPPEVAADSRIAAAPRSLRLLDTRDATAPPNLPARAL